MTEETTYNLRIDGKLKAAFLAAADRNDRSAAGLLREFMREYVAANKGRHNSIAP